MHYVEKSSAATAVDQDICYTLRHVLAAAVTRGAICAACQKFPFTTHQYAVAEHGGVRHVKGNACETRAPIETGGQGAQVLYP